MHNDPFDVSTAMDLVASTTVISPGLLFSPTVGAAKASVMTTSLPAMFARLFGHSRKARISRSIWAAGFFQSITPSSLVSLRE
jgi:hypothetical protein